MMGFGRKDDNDDDKASDQIKQYQDAMKKLGEQYDASQKELAAAQAKIKDLEGQLQKSKGASIQAQGVSSQQLSQLKAEDAKEDAAFQQQISQLQQQLQQAQQAQQEVQQLRSRVAELEGALGQAQQQSSSFMYTIQPGDSLSAIAQKFYGDGSQWPRIFEANRNTISNPDLIHAGETIAIPR